MCSPWINTRKSLWTCVCRCACVPVHICVASVFVKDRVLWIQVIHLPCKVNCNGQRLQHHLHLDCLHFSCVTIHFAPGWDKKNFSIKRIAPLQLPAHQASQGIMLHSFKSNWPTQSLQEPELPSALIKQFTLCYQRKQMLFSLLHSSFTLTVSGSYLGPLPWPWSTSYSKPHIPHPLHPTQIAFVLLAWQDWALDVNMTLPPSQRFPWLTQTTNLGGVDCSQELTEAFGLIKEIYICSLTSNAVSLHRPGTLWLHNQNLNIGEKKRKNRHNDDNYLEPHSRTVTSSNNTSCTVDQRHRIQIPSDSFKVNRCSEFWGCR